MDRFVIIFINNILIYSKDEAKYREHLKIILQILHEKQLHTKLSKSEFWLNKIIFLGHIILAEGILIDPQKISAIVNWEPPTSSTEVNFFLDLEGYYQRFVENFLIITSPITKLLRKNAKFVWAAECEKKFDELKR